MPRDRRRSRRRRGSPAGRGSSPRRTVPGTVRPWPRRGPNPR
ncbi:hypothetical protein ACFFX0_25505 [Citricoccus parietis]|uniref:Uncharacterized protein n=1 Tax=Citricoccus parietis TaxID=592307 RepID=A0ABV5G5Z6_9MICC